MPSGMVGADSDALDGAAAELEVAADQLDSSAQVLVSSLGAMSWLGAVALRFSDQWQSMHQPAMFRTAGFLRDNASHLRRQAAEQRTASSAEGGSNLAPSTSRPPVENQQQTSESRVVTFSQLLNRQQHIDKEGRFEILKVSDNPPRYIVNLPGVEFGQTDQPHLRDLVSAVRARITGVDAYAERVKLEMQRAGVPANAEVMLVGHSYGAIAALNIARDAEFNQPLPTATADGYHVNITHVVAAGAGLRDWIDDPPVGTNVLLAVNRNDVIAQGIQLPQPEMPKVSDLLAAPRAIVNDIFDVPDASSAAYGDGRRLMEFSTNEDPLGHNHDNYGIGLDHADSESRAWLDSAAQLYFKGDRSMQVTRVWMPDSVSYGATQ